MKTTTDTTELPYDATENRFLDEVKSKAERYLTAFHSSKFNEFEAKRDLQRIFYRHYHKLYDSGRLWIEPEVWVLVKPVVSTQAGYLITININVVDEGVEKLVTHQFVLTPLNKKDLINSYFH